MISILSKAATWSRDQLIGETFSRVFNSRLRSAQLIWTAVTPDRHRNFPLSSSRVFLLRLYDAVDRCTRRSRHRRNMGEVVLAGKAETTSAGRPF